MKNNPTGAMGVADHLGWNWKSSAGLPVVNIPGCPAQPDNMTEVLLYLALHLAGRAPGPRPRRAAAPALAVRPHGARGLQPRRLLRGGPVRDRVRRRPALPGQARLQGAGGEVQRPGPRLGRRLRRLPERGRHLHGLHDARLPRQVHAVHGRGPERAAWRPRSSSSRSGRCSSYFRHRNIKNKYDVEPEWRKPAATLGDRLSAAQLLVGKRGIRNGDSGDTARRPEGHGQGDVVGSDHPDRRQPRHPHRDRLLQPGGPQVLQHVDDLPRLRHLHEGDRSARRALHHQPDLRHLR